MSSNHELTVEAPLERGISQKKGRLRFAPWNSEAACAVAECKRLPRTRGWCQHHYGFWLVYGTPEPHNAPDLENEEWRSAPGWEATYKVSNQGRIKNSGTGRILRPRYTKGRRYAAIHLPLNGKSTDRYLHVLVAEAFLGPAPEGKEVNHRDGDRHNNALSNLEYITHRENMRHAWRLGLMRSRKVVFGQMELVLGA